MTTIQEESSTANDEEETTLWQELMGTDLLLKVCTNVEAQNCQIYDRVDKY